MTTAVFNWGTLQHYYYYYHHYHMIDSGPQRHNDAQPGDGEVGREAGGARTEEVLWTHGARNGGHAQRLLRAFRRQVRGNVKR